MLTISMRRTLLSTTILFTVICQMGLLHGQSETPNRDPSRVGPGGQVPYDSDPDADIYTEQGFKYPGPPTSTSGSSSYSNQPQSVSRTQPYRQVSLAQRDARRQTRRLSASGQSSRLGQVRYRNAGPLQIPFRRPTYGLAPQQSNIPRFSDLGIASSPSQLSAYEYMNRRPVQPSLSLPIRSQDSGRQRYAHTRSTVRYTRPSVATGEGLAQVLPSSAWNTVSSQRADRDFPRAQGQYQSAQTSSPQYKVYVSPQDQVPRHQGSSIQSPGYQALSQQFQEPSPVYQVQSQQFQDQSPGYQVQSQQYTESSPQYQTQSHQFQEPSPGYQVQLQQHQRSSGRYKTERLRSESHHQVGPDQARVRSQYRQRATAPFQVASKYQIDTAAPRKISTHEKSLTRAKQSKDFHPNEPLISQQLDLARHTERAVQYQREFPPTHKTVQEHSSQKQSHASQQPIRDQIGHFSHSTKDTPGQRGHHMDSVLPVYNSRHVPAPSLITIPQPSEFVIANEVTRTRIPSKKSNTRESSAKQTMTSSQHVEYQGLGAAETDPELGLDQLRIDALSDNFNLTATGSVFLSAETRRKNEIALQNVVRRRPRGRRQRRRRV